MFTHIVVPLDGSSLAECVLPHVVTFARAFKARVTLLRVLNNGADDGPMRLIDPLDWEMHKAEAAAYLNATAQRLEAADVPVARQLMEGGPTRCIVEFAHSHDVDLMILASHGQSGLGYRSVRSVALKVMQQINIATLIVRAYQPVADVLDGHCYRRILVPLDGSQRAECVTPAVTQLAHSCKAQVLLAHIVGMPQMPRRSPPIQEDLELRDKWVARSQENAVKYLEQLQSSSFAYADTRLVVEEDVIAGLHRMVDAEGADLVVLSAHGYSANPQRHYGSVTSDFIEFDNAPLLVIQDLTPADMRLYAAKVQVREGQDTTFHPNSINRPC